MLAIAKILRLRAIQSPVADGGLANGARDFDNLDFVFVEQNVDKRTGFLLSDSAVARQP
jgi:hypothetical protein